VTEEHTGGNQILINTQPLVAVFKHDIALFPIVGWHGVECSDCGLDYTALVPDTTSGKLIRVDSQRAIELYGEFIEISMRET
jgi:hypothetical protein